MEALALLCTLHADGPATLRRLRRAGCGTLEALEAYEPEALADLLRLTPAAARRFEREARMLCARLTTDILDREEAPESVRAVSVDTFVGDTGALRRKDREILGKVLERWGHDEPSSAHAASAPRVQEPAPAPEPEPEREAARPGIEPGLIDGLDAGVSSQLSDLGVTDLGSLAEAAPLELARALGQGFAQVRRWQFLARRTAAELPEPPPTTASPVAAGTDDSTRRDLPAAGPPLDGPPPTPPITVRKPWPVQAVPVREPRDPATAPERAPARPAPSWEPRKFWEAPGGGEPQDSSAEAGRAEADRAAAGRADAEDKTPRTTLNWNFEIPPPPPLPPLATRPDEVEQAGGPFA